MARRMLGSKGLKVRTDVYDRNENILRRITRNNQRRRNKKCVHIKRRGIGLSAVTIANKERMDLGSLDVHQWKRDKL